MPALKGTAADAEAEPYAFTKRLCQVLVLLGSQQLCPMWGTPALPQPPAHFAAYLDALYGFSVHPRYVAGL